MDSTSAARQASIAKPTDALRLSVQNWITASTPAGDSLPYWNQNFDPLEPVSLATTIPFLLKRMLRDFVSTLLKPGTG